MPHMKKYVSERESVLTKEEAEKVRANLPDDQELKMLILMMDRPTEYVEAHQRQIRELLHAWLDSLTKE